VHHALISTITMAVDIKRRSHRALLLGAATLATLAVVFALGELVARVLDGRTHDAIEKRIGGPPFCLRASSVPGLVYEFTPRRCGKNSYGFGGPDPIMPKPPGLYRVVVIGDSVANGVGLTGDDKAFPMWMRERLQARRGGDVEVLTLAVPGYGTDQELIVLEQQVARYQPDLIVWSYVLNDAANVRYHDVSGDIGAYFYRPASRLWAALSRSLFSLRERLRGRHCPSEYHRFLHCAYAHEVVASFARMARWSQATGIPIVVAIHPIHSAAHVRDGHSASADFSSYADYPLTDLHRQLVAIIESEHLRAIDLLPAFNGRRSDEVGSAGDVWHPNALGHQLVGTFLGDRL
jgi:lysophospholipase L1-like esterase